MNIQPVPVTTVNLAIQLSEQEARAILVDPASFQKQLRVALADHGTRGTRTPHSLRERGAGERIVLNGRARRFKETSPAPKGAKGRRAFERVPCSKCNRPIATSQMKRHLSRCRGTAFAATASA